MPEDRTYLRDDLPKQNRDTNLGNPDGDVVDNSAGENPVDGAQADKKSNRGLRSQGGMGVSGGISLGMYGGKPSWLSGLDRGSVR